MAFCDILTPYRMTIEPYYFYLFVTSIPFMPLTLLEGTNHENASESTNHFENVLSFCLESKK